MHVTKHGSESRQLCVVLHLHVSLTTGGNWWRVTRMMRKMMIGQASRVRDHSCNTRYDKNSNQGKRS